MSLYTFSSNNSLPFIKPVSGLQVKVCNNTKLLSVMAGVPEAAVEKRLDEDHVAFLATINEHPAAFGWIATSKAVIGELNHTMVLPRRNRYLWNFRTLEAYRGLGIYPALLQHIIRTDGDNADRFWIIHAPENKSSLNGIVKAGFEYTGKLYTNNGITLIEKTNISTSHKELLTGLNIFLSAATPASCWNCSSPYVKKRFAQCCCITEGRRCYMPEQISLPF